MLGKILVADDSLTVRMHLQDVLVGAGFEVTLCETRAELMERLSRESFSLIVLDPTLRDGAGLHIVRDLRQGPAKTTTPILLLSSQTELRRRVLSLDLGADDVIDKPWHDEYLLDRVFDLTVGSRAITRVVEGVRPARLLVVDDSVTYGTALADDIRRDGHDVVLARTAREAISFLAVQSAACVILDVFMPEVSGVQLCRQLRADPGMRNTSILVVTGRKDSALSDAVLAAGADDFVAKEHDLSLIRARVRDMLNHPRRGRRFRPDSQSRMPPVSTPSAPPSSPSSGVLLKTTGPLLDKVISASGMSEMLGRSTLRRACERAGVNPSSMSPDDLARALPFIAQTLGLFAPPEEVRGRMERIAALAGRETAA